MSFVGINNYSLYATNKRKIYSKISNILPQYIKAILYVNNIIKR